MRIEESLNVNFDESLPEPKSSSLVEDDRIIEPVVQNPVRSPSLQVNASKPSYPESLKEARGHPIEQVNGELNERTLRYYFYIPTLTLHFRMYGHDYAWDLRKLGRVLNVSSKGTLFFTKSTNTKAFMKLKNYHPSSFECDRPVNSIMIQNTIMRPEFHCEGIPSKSWEKHQLHPYLNARADVLLSNVFAKIEAQEILPIIIGFMLYYIKTKTPFNFAYFIARRLSGLDYNNEALLYARVMTTLFEYLKNKHRND
ncbi:hypothetical protein Tco_0683644 [Tanacetum coccineum]